jgi:hypothetical protein
MLWMHAPTWMKLAAWLHGLCRRAELKVLVSMHGERQHGGEEVVPALSPDEVQVLIE